jgi:hypothetical protein
MRYRLRTCVLLFLGAASSLTLAPTAATSQYVTLGAGRYQGYGYQPQYYGGYPAYGYGGYGYAPPSYYGGYPAYGYGGPYVAPGYNYPKYASIYGVPPADRPGAFRNGYVWGGYGRGYPAYGYGGGYPVYGYNDGYAFRRGGY